MPKKEHYPKKWNELTPKQQWSIIHSNERQLRKNAGSSFNADYTFVIAALPKPKCKRCHGRGWTGRSVEFDRVIPCACIEGWAIKNLDNVSIEETTMDFLGNIAIGITEGGIESGAGQNSIVGLGKEPNGIS